MPYRLFKNRPMQLAWLLILLSIASCAQTEVSQNNNINPVVIISLDGFRYDYIEKYQTPNLLDLINTGVRAERMIPAYPSKTFPNHISIVTGMYPSKHGIVHNKFYDRELNDVYRMGKAFEQPKWMQGTPLWIHAVRNGMITANYFWAESDSTLEGLSSTYSHHYDKKKPYQERIDQIIDWLKLPQEKRPTFITGYFSLVDSIGHQHGPDSQQVKEAVLTMDNYMGQLKSRLDTELDFKVNLVIVSDHGMIDIDYEKRVVWPELNDFKNFKVVNGATQLMAYANESVNQSDIKALVTQLNAQSNNRFKAHKKQDLPKHTHYFNNDRVADIIVEAIPPFVFTSSRKNYYPYKGTHGYDPDIVKEMGAIFIANGPNFKEGVTIPEFRNIHVFPALVDILGLPMPTNIDGKLEVLKPILK